MDPRNENHLHLGDIGIYALLALAGVAIAGYFLVAGVAAGELVAVVAATVVVVLGLLATGAGGVLVVLNCAGKAEEKRARRDQEVFVLNAQENLAIMHATAKTQATQNSMLLKQAREAQRALPAPEVTDLGFEFEESSFLELGD